ncbi:MULTISPECIES: DUF5362 family protein [Chryseobacterium]|uniref:DUF5362 domain-containing protein n=1 Tax=Chryseobacterium taihuense TaxID=1141221 RepID=A0A4U8WD02_9FLAO|nr:MULTISPECIES: DUF5362 family protein [Chryseobacterium]QQV03519.1 hypothetical protein I6I61_04050 [Chryseobacterium sp. FDAARGOS 1104]VFB03150.1 Uncharacterised protein [Chryseobacterium taihuense]
MEKKSPFEQFEELKIDRISKEFLAEAAKWTAFLAILGFIGIGFFFIAGLVMLSFSSMSKSMTGSFVMSIVYLLVAGFYLVPINFLYKFSTNMKNALRNNNQSALANAFEYLKSHYKFIGILTLILISFYVMIFIWLMLTTVGSHF